MALKNILTRNIILLCILYSVERFVFYSFRSTIIFYLIQYLSLSDTKAFNVYGYVSIITFTSYILSAVLIDHVKLFRDLRLLFLVIGIGAAILFIKGLVFMITGMTVIILAGVFIKVNIFLKIFENLPTELSKYDNAYILLYVLINLATSVSAPYASYVITKLNYKIGLPLVIIIPWVIYASIFLKLYSANAHSTRESSFPPVNKFRLYIVIAAIILIANFLRNRGPNDISFNDETNSSIYILQYIIPIISYTIIGLVTLFIIKPNLQFKKIGIAILLLGVISLLHILANYLKTYPVAIVVTVQIFNGITEILIYPAIFSLTLLLAKLHRRGTTVSVVFIVLNILSWLANMIYIEDGNILSIVLSIIALVLAALLILHRKQFLLVKYDNQ